MNKLQIALVVTAITLGAAGGGYWYGAKVAAKQSPGPTAGKPPGGPGAPGAGPAAGGPPGVAVDAVKVEKTPLPQGITAVGSLRSDESVMLRPEVGGRIAEIGFSEGQHVVRGTTLVKLDAAVTRAEVEQAKANLVLAKAKYERAVDLQNKGFISSQARDEAENALRIAEATVSLAQAKLAKTEVKAPFSGVIGLRQISVGDYVKEGQDMVNLEATDSLKVDFRVPEAFVTQVRGGQPLQLAVDAHPGEVFAGKVLAVNPLLDANGRAVSIRAVVPNGSRKLSPGMFARVRLFTKDQKEALVVPETALFPVGDDQYLYKVVDGKALRTKVDIGQRRDSKVEILAGLGTDDLVVVAGQLKLRDGAPVRLNNGATSAAAAPAAATAAPAAVLRNGS